MTRRLFRLLAVLCAMGLFTAACADDGDDDTVEAGDTATDGDRDGAAGAADFETIEEGVLTVCSDIPYAPFEFEEGGEVKGIDVDLMKAMADELQLEAEFLDTDFDGIFAALSAGKCDVIASSVSITDEREENNDFTEGYFEINQSLLVRADEKDEIDALDDLDGKVVGVQSETTGAAYAEENADDNGYTVKEFTGADELFTALAAGQVDGVLQDFPINSYHAETTGESAIATVFEAEEKEQYGFVIDADNDALREALDAALAELRENGTYDEILTEYLGEQ